MAPPNMGSNNYHSQLHNKTVLDIFDSDEEEGCIGSDESVDYNKVMEKASVYQWPSSNGLIQQMSQPESVNSSWEDVTIKACSVSQRPERAYFNSIPPQHVASMTEKCQPSVDRRPWRNASSSRLNNQSNYCYQPDQLHKQPQTFFEPHTSLLSNSQSCTCLSDQQVPPAHHLSLQQSRHQICAPRILPQSSERPHQFRPYYLTPSTQAQSLPHSNLPSFCQSQHDLFRPCAPVTEILGTLHPQPNEPIAGWNSHQRSTLCTPQTSSSSLQYDCRYQVSLPENRVLPIGSNDKQSPIFGPPSEPQTDQPLLSCTRNMTDRTPHHQRLSRCDSQPRQFPLLVESTQPSQRLPPSIPPPPSLSQHQANVSSIALPPPPPPPCPSGLLVNGNVRNFATGNLKRFWNTTAGCDAPTTKRQQRSPSASPFFCNPCDRSFLNQQKYDQHVDEEHVSCDHPNCGYSAAPMIVEAHKLRHITKQDGTSLFDDPSETKLWIKSRRVNFPSKANITKKEEARRRGEATVSNSIECCKIEKLLRTRFRKSRGGNALRRRSDQRPSAIVPSIESVMKRQRQWLLQEFRVQKRDTSKRHVSSHRQEFSNAELQKSDFPICEHFLKFRTCKWEQCHYSHDTAAYHRWKIQRNLRGFDIPMRPPLLYQLLLPEIQKSETLLLAALRYFVSKNFFCQEAAPEEANGQLLSPLADLGNDKEAALLDAGSRDQTIEILANGRNSWDVRLRDKSGEEEEVNSLFDNNLVGRKEDETASWILDNPISQASNDSDSNASGGGRKINTQHSVSSEGSERDGAENSQPSHRVGSEGKRARGEASPKTATLTLTYKVPY